MTELAICTRQLTRRFGDATAVGGVDLNIARGQIYGFLGPNGSGKTTTIRMLCGLLTPTEGSVDVLGMRIPDEAEALRRRIGYMTQKFALYDDLTVEENMRFISRIFGLGRAQTTQRIDELLEYYDLVAMRRRRAADMSGGQRQRLALATATLHRPELLFLDEPTSAVDPENRRAFWEKLFDLVDQGTTILVSTHYMDEAERCHELAILNLGQLCAQGSPARLMHQLGGRVVEVHGPKLRQAKDALLQLPQVQSAAQQGLALRVLLREPCQDAATILASALPGGEHSFEEARASLEDVFVASTGDNPHAERHQ